MSTLTVHFQDTGLQRIVEIARQLGSSVDDFVASAALEKASAIAEMDVLKRDSALASREAFDDALNAVRALNTPADPGDEMPEMP